MLRTERGILPSRLRGRDGDGETGGRATLARMILGGWSRARYGALMPRLCGIVRTSSPTARVHNFRARKEKGEATIDPRRDTDDSSRIQRPDAGIFMTYPWRNFIPRQWIAGMYSVNNLIMSRGVVEHEWHSETLRGELQETIMVINNQMNSEINFRCVLLRMRLPRV